MTTQLLDADGDVLAENLTVKELELLAAQGVTIETTEQPDESGDGSGSSPDDDAVVDELTELTDSLEAMEDAADDDNAGEWWDAGDPDDYSTADDIDERRAERLAEKLRDSLSELGQMKSERDENADENTALYWSGDEIHARVQDSEFVDELTDALKELTTRDRDVPATSGHSLNIDAVVRQRAGAYGERDLYMRRLTAESGDRAVSVALDLSGSMSEVEAKEATAALAEATEVIGDDFMAVGYHTQGSSPKTPLVTAPDEEFEYDHLDAVSTGGGTPTASGIQAAVRLLKEASKPEDLVICVTDGQANKVLAGGSSGDAERDVRNVVQSARESGATVIGLGISAADDEYMESLFGDDYVTAGMDDLVDALVDIYRGQLSTPGMGQW